MLHARTLWFLVTLLAGLSAVVVAQTVSTEILGLVTDPSGAVIPGATVTAKRLATGDVRTTTANETGNYVFPLLEWPLIQRIPALATSVGARCYKGVVRATPGSYGPRPAGFCPW